MTAFGASASTRDTIISLSKRYSSFRAIFQENSFPLMIFALILIICRIGWLLKHYSPITLKFQLDSEKKVKSYVRKLPRLSLAIQSDKHYIGSYRLSAQPQYRDAYLKPKMNPKEYDLLPMDYDLPKMHHVKKRNAAKIVASSNIQSEKSDIVISSQIDVTHKIEITTATVCNDILNLSSLIVAPTASVFKDDDPSECQECDELTFAFEHCMECNADLCDAHIEVHKYYKSMIKHTFVSIKVINYN